VGKPLYPTGGSTEERMSPYDKLVLALSEQGRLNEAGEFLKNDPENPEGEYFESAASYVQSELLGFCGCGIPSETRMHVLAVLERFSDENDRWHSDDAADTQLFGPQASRYFMWYWLAHHGYIEHGYSLPGWLSKKGLWLRDVLRAVAAWEQSDNPWKDA